MPYTPPSQLSPATSKVSTPNPSRSSSYINGAVSPVLPQSNDARPQLPRSTSSSYLNKHRRSPSTPTGNEPPEAMTDLQRGIGFDPHSSLRQSPPPVTNGLIPAGMTISPPESSQNSDDEEVRGRSRELERENLAQLQAAIRSIKGERKSGSPVREAEKPQATILQDGITHSPMDARRPPLSSSQRKISHSRSNTDSNIVFEQSSTLHQHRPEPPQLLSPRYGAESDTDESDNATSRPPMVRKKSGELVRPALRASSRRRPSSMPGTPTYSKAVHFDSQLEHIRHFLQVDRPLAVSAGSSPVDNYESETEFPFGSDESSARRRGYEWEIRLANFPEETPSRKMNPVYVERVFLSADNKQLIGTVAVHNMSFQKQVNARFTLDYWKTTSEVLAEYVNDLRRKDAPDGLDRFNFSISLADQANLENKTLFFCVRYLVNGQEFWDNNGSVNYQVDFSKKAKTKTAPQPAPGLGARPLNSLPRSRPSPPVSSGRPKSMPVSFDDFASGIENFGSSFGQAPGTIIGEPRIKLRSPRSKSELVPDAPARRNKSITPMFGHRYDFNSSLNAAKSNAFAVLGEQSGLSLDTKQSSRDVPAVAAKPVSGVPPQLEKGANRSLAAPVQPPSATAPMTATPAALLTEKPPLSSQSYQELVDKYCFFGSGNRSPTTTTRKVTVPATDGSSDDNSVSDFSAGSAQSSGASTPIAGFYRSPPSEVSSIKTASPQISRSSSPASFGGSCKSARSPSPAALVYGYNSSSSQTLLAEAPHATAIHG